MPICKYCGEEVKANRIQAHKLVKHKDELDEDEATIAVPDGELKEKEVEKGEQFGYEK